MEGIIRHTKAAAVSVAVLGLTASAAPTLRDVSAPTIADFTRGALEKFLAGQNAAATFSISGPWAPITYAGDNSAMLSADVINNLIFGVCDVQPVPGGNETVNFSDRYKDFIQDMNQAVPHPPPSAAQNASAAAEQQACFGDNYNNQLSAALKAYNMRAHTPINDVTSNTFITWAQENYPSYDMARQNCTQATLSYFSTKDKENGDDFDIYAGAYARVEPLINSNELVVGINMPVKNVSQAANSDSSQPGNNLDAGDYVAYYQIPTLNSTLSKWQGGSGLAPFAYSATSTNYTSSDKTSSSGGSFGVTYEEVGVNGHFGTTDAKYSSETKASSYSVSFGGLALVGISQGAWFDGYTVARAAQNPDSAHTAVLSVFSESKYFGSKDQPGALSVYNYEALVGFQPTWTITLQDSISNNSQHSYEGGGGISVLGLFDIGGYVGSNSTKVSIDNSTNTFTVADNTSNAYILGFVQKQYWT
ncbi:hypothetical protein C8R47DRAFT_1319447 [Mycena vitilis]|nr:hypothetical protein C8R47DRAFT_1319447 [Mycena vitilis]